jgi:hypothetical protein
MIYEEILDLKHESLEKKRPIEHTAIIIDVFANNLKDMDITET